MSVRTRRVPSNRGARPPVGTIYSEDEDEPIGTILGQKPGSKEEWWVALALWALKWEFEYQVPIMGGRIPGGQVVDFVVYTPGRPTPLQPYDEYWHSARISSEDNFKLVLVEEAFGVAPVVIWGQQMQTKEDTYEAVFKAFGRGPG